MLHRDHGTLACIGHAHALFQRHLLVGGPQPAHRQPQRLGLRLDGLEDLGRRRAGVGIGGTDAGIDGPEPRAGDRRRTERPPPGGLDCGEGDETALMMYSCERKESEGATVAVGYRKLKWRASLSR